MTSIRPFGLAALAAGAAALALPAVAGAHPSVYRIQALTGPVADATDPGSPGGTEITEAELVEQTRYVFTNHNISAVFRETNGVTTGGAFSWNRLPSAWRSQPSKLVDDKKAWFDLATEGVQVHATCQGVPALASRASILSWQDGSPATESADPFYGYIPFQKASAGFDDDPADWIPVVQALTGVDLATVADPAAACAGLGGSYTVADEYNTKPTTADPDLPFKALSSHTIEHEVERAVAPLEAKIAELEAAKTAAEKALADAQAAAKTMADKAAASAAQLKVATTPLGIALGGTSLSVKQLGAGVAVKLTGPSAERAFVEVLVSAAQAKKLKLASRRVATATTTLGADATTVTLTPSSAVKAALGGLKGATTITVRVSAGGRSVSTSATLTA